MSIAITHNSKWFFILCKTPMRPLVGDTTMTRESRQRGVALLEVLIAMVVFAIGVMGLSALQMRTLAVALDSSQRTVVIAKTQDIADRMRSNRDSISNYTNTYNAAFCSTDSGSSCADSVSGDASSCSAAQMATYDLWDVFCKEDTGMNDGVIAWQTVISCSDTSGTCATADSVASITTTWVMRSNDNDERVRGGKIVTGGDGAGGGEVESDAATDQMILSFVP